MGKVPGVVWEKAEDRGQKAEGLLIRATKFSLEFPFVIQNCFREFLHFESDRPD